MFVVNVPGDGDTLFWGFARVWVGGWGYPIPRNIYAIELKNGLLSNCFPFHVLPVVELFLRDRSQYAYNAQLKISQRIGK